MNETKDKTTELLQKLFSKEEFELLQTVIECKGEFKEREPNV
jgi:hypothetical protein